MIDGFIVDGRTRAGIRVAVSQFVTVENCHTGNNGRWGIFSGFADDLTVEGNEAHHSQAEHGIYVSNSGDRPVIRRNVVHDNHANGIHMNGDLSQGGDGLISGALVEQNVIYGNGAGGGSGINMDGVTDSVVRNNLLYDNHASGVSLYRIDGATGSKRNVVVNNTIVNAADARWCVNVNGGSTDNTVLNNILSSTGASSEGARAASSCPTSTAPARRSCSGMRPSVQRSGGTGRDSRGRAAAGTRGASPAASWRWSGGRRLLTSASASPRRARPRHAERRQGRRSPGHAGVARGAGALPPRRRRAGGRAAGDARSRAHACRTSGRR